MKHANNGGTLTLLGLLLLLGSAQSADVFYEWDLEAILDNTLSPDCMNVKDARRTMFLVANDTVAGGGLFPGPLIEATEGDTIHVSAGLYVIEPQSQCHCVSYTCLQKRWDRTR
jgi:hypothetical protein